MKLKEENNVMMREKIWGKNESGCQRQCFLKIEFITPL